MPIGVCKHFVGATYELTQKNMQKLIQELEEAQAEIKELEIRMKFWRAYNNCE